MIRRFGKGFTLIELMIVVAIIGILAAIAIPNFVKFQCRSKQSEAKGNLKSIYVSQESYRAENDTYIGCGSSGIAGTCVASNSLGFSPKGTKVRYNYSSSQAAGPAFSSTASGLAQFATELNNDIWTITQANDLQQGATRGCD